MLHPVAHARATPDKAAYIMAATGETVTYGELDRRANQGAHLLRSLGLKRGDAIAVMMDNNARYLEIMWAAERTGVYVTCLSSKLLVDEAEYILRDGDCRVLIVSKAIEAQAAALLTRIGDMRRFMVGGTIEGYDGYEAARQANGRRDSRHRIEHIEVITASDVPRFAELGVIASMQPPHPPGAMDFPLEPTLSRIGRARWPLSYAWRTLKQAGAHVVFASDWPVSPIDPILGMKAAICRKPWAEGDPDQSFSLTEALAAYTVEGAYAEFMEHAKGRLKPGYMADLVVLSKDIEAVDPNRLDEVRPVTTICGGRITFRA